MCVLAGDTSCEPGAWDYMVGEVNREEVEVDRRVRFLSDNSQWNNLRSVVRGSGVRVGLMASFLSLCWELGYIWRRR